MPELLIDFITSLDGYGAADGWPGWWGLEGPEYLAWLGEQPEATYTLRSRRPVEGGLLEHVDGAALVAEHATRER
jgi:hypothetical protein